MFPFASILLFALTFRPLVVRCDFCSNLKTLSKGKAIPVPNLKFIPTKDVIYLYVNLVGTHNVTTRPAQELVYELDVSCTAIDNCPAIGKELQFSQVFKGLSGLKDAFIHNDFTYLMIEKSQIVYKFENNVKVEEIRETDFWANITHATVYKWTNAEKTVLSRFIPPKSPSGPPRYAFSFDTFDGTWTVELKGNYEMVNIVKYEFYDGYNRALTLYTFGDYLVPFDYHSYLPLPSGDDLFNSWFKPVFVRKDGVSLFLYQTQNLNDVFGCTKKALPEKILTDTRSDNIYPSYFKD